MESRSGTSWKSEDVVEGKPLGTGDAVPEAPVLLPGFSIPGVVVGYSRPGIYTYQRNLDLCFDENILGIQDLNVP